MCCVWNTLQQDFVQIGGCGNDFQYNLFANSGLLEYLLLWCSIQLEEDLGGIFHP